MKPDSLDKHLANKWKAACNHKGCGSRGLCGRCCAAAIREALAEADSGYAELVAAVRTLLVILDSRAHAYDGELGRAIVLLRAVVTSPKVRAGLKEADHA